MTEVDFMYKVVVIGDSGVGKSNLITRFTMNKFTEDSKSTIGVEFGAKNIEIDGKTIKGQIWDTAGQERFRAISTAYYRGAHGALIVYDVTKKDSFQNIEKWKSEIVEQGEPDCQLMMVGNKSDLVHLRQVDVSEGKRYAENNKMFFLETSACEGTNVEEAFTTLLEAIYRQNQETGGKKETTNNTNETTIKVTDPSTNQNVGGDPATGGCKC
eukprot:gene5660-9476_t